MLYLSYLRSLGVVSAALVSAFPTEESWNTLRNSEEFIRELNYFSSLIADIKQTALTEGLDDAAISNNYDIVLDGVSEFATKYNIPVEDLVYVLIHA